MMKFLKELSKSIKGLTETAELTSHRLDVIEELTNKKACVVVRRNEMARRWGSTSPLNVDFISFGSAPTGRKYDRIYVLDSAFDWQSANSASKIKARDWIDSHLRTCLSPNGILEEIY